MSQQLIELSYAKYADFHSKQNWIYSQPHWSTLNEGDQKWWKEFVLGIRNGYKPELVEKEIAKLKAAE